MFKICGTDGNIQIQAQETADLVAALSISREMRDAGYTLVWMVSENTGHAGKPCIDTIVDGKMAEGHDYDWSKAGRASKPRAGDRVIEKKTFSDRAVEPSCRGTVLKSISRPILPLCLALFSFAVPCRAATGAEQEVFVERLRQVVVGIVVTEAERTPDPQSAALAARFGISRTIVEQSNVLAARKPGTRRIAGSGMVVSADGLVLTTGSLFQRHQSIEIHTEAGAEYAGTLILRDRISGLALVKIQSPLVWDHLRIEKPAQSMSVGERVLAFGLVFQGEKWKSTVTQGAIAELERSDVMDETEFKSSAPMAGRNLEGGPLVGASSGEVIGINLFEGNWGPQKGKTQASPIENYIKIRTDLQSHGRVVRPYIGLAMGQLRAEDKQALSSFERAIKGGIVVFGTAANGPAHLAGIERGDIVLRLNANEVLSVSGFNRTLHGLNPGDQIVLTVLRKGVLLPLKINTVEMDSPS